MPLATRPFRFARHNRRLTQSEIEQRERDLEDARRHRNCEDDPCDSCRSAPHWCAEDDCPNPPAMGDYLCREHAAERDRDDLRSTVVQTVALVVGVLAVVSL